MRSRHLLLILTLGAAPTLPLAADHVLISELLTWTAEAPDWQEHLRQRLSQGWKPPARRSELEDIESLISFWEYRPFVDEKKLDATSLERLLAYCEKNPLTLARLAFRFEATDPDVTARIQQIYARMPSGNEDEKKAQSVVMDWLMTKAGLFRSELRKKAESVFSNAEDEDIRTYLDGYLRHEPAEGEKLLLAHAEDVDPASRALALMRLYDFDSAQWRAALQELVVSDASTRTRIEVLRHLAAKDWPGRTEWLLSLFQHAELGYLKVEYTEIEPFAEVVKANPDMWIPLVTKWIGHTNRAVHDNAVRCLIQFQNPDIRQAALEPLLPWLSDPAWALNEDHDGRLRLIQSLHSVNLPQSIPGLMWVAEHGSGYELSFAALALSHYQAREAAPILRRALEREPEGHHQRDIAEALIKLDGFSADEIVDGVLALVEQNLTDEKRASLKASTDPINFSDAPKIAPAQLAQIITGQCANKLPQAQRNEVAQAIMNHSQKQRAHNATLADALELHIVDWGTPSSEQILSQRLQSGQLDAQWMMHLLEHTPYVENAPPMSRAISAVVSGNIDAALKLLADTDPNAQAMVLACARLKRQTLPTSSVQPMLKSPHLLVQRAALTYLETLDTPEARKLVWTHFPGEARIIGARMGFDPGHFSFRNFDRLEDVLRERLLKPEGPEEIHALLSAGYWGDAGQIWIEKRADGAWLVNTGSEGRQRVRKLLAEEYTTLLSYIKEHHVNELPPLTLSVHDGLQLEHVHLTREGGLRVFMNNPGNGGDLQPDDTVYANLVASYRDLLRDTSLLTVDYPCVPGVKIEIPAEKMSIQEVWGRDGQIFIQSHHPDYPQNRWHTIDRKLAEGQFPSIANLQNTTSDSHLLNADWLSGGLRVGEHPKTEKQGIWRSDTTAGDSITEGRFAFPVLSSDSNWVVVSRALGSSWAEPNDIVRINLDTGKSIPIDLPPADDFRPVTRLPGNGLILLCRSPNSQALGSRSDKRPEEPEYYLLDASTGKTQRVQGEFRPLHDEKWRPLQPTKQPGVVWATLPLVDKEDRIGTLVGRYDLERFQFETVRKVRGLRFDSLSCWVDETANRVWISLNEDLLSLPLSGN